MQIKLLKNYAAFDYEITHAGNSMFLLKIWRRDKDWEPTTLLLGKFLRMTIEEFTEFLMNYNNTSAAKRLTVDDYKEIAVQLMDDFFDLLVEAAETLPSEEMEEIEDAIFERYEEKCLNYMGDDE